jgi:hypothetical protein
MWQMVAVPTAQGVIAGIFKKKLQRRRFDMAVAKYHVGFALMTGIRGGRIRKTANLISSPEQTNS